MVGGLRGAYNLMSYVADMAAYLIRPGFRWANVIVTELTARAVFPEACQKGWYRECSLAGVG